MKINIELSQSSVKDAINQLVAYNNSLKDKNSLFVHRLAELGVPVIESNIARAAGDSNPLHDISIHVMVPGNVARGVLKLQGEDILFFEFGSGIYYNETDPPHASEFGYGVGTYPGQTHAFDDRGWWYVDSDGQKHHSYGTQATMPMLKATSKIIQGIRRIAREVYAS